MQILKQLRDLLYKTDMTYEEIRGFELGIMQLSIEDQVVLYKAMSANTELIYPAYVNYMAKRNAKLNNRSWDEAVSQEIQALEKNIETKRIGEEITPIYA